MQPPPRKVKESQLVKLVFAEQLSKLQTKQHQDTELLEDIRYNVSRIVQDLHDHFHTRYLDAIGVNVCVFRSVFAVWRSVVDGTAQTAASRLAAAEEYRKLIGQASRGFRNGLERLQSVQGEMVDALRELHRIKKRYHQLSHIAGVVREKAADAQTRARKSEHGIFHFKTGLHKMTAKLSARLKESDDRLTEVRNEYLLALAAVNAHQQHYYTNDLPHIMEGKPVIYQNTDPIVS
uniref:F-BAR domain-containing protein n=1 Tax=Monopterus albus TaxID=43700 RepID=A0A3Q3KSK9_MONAL